jgi:hypothetical protein
MDATRSAAFMLLSASDMAHLVLRVGSIHAKRSRIESAAFTRSSMVIRPTLSSSARND